MVGEYGIPVQASKETTIVTMSKRVKAMAETYVQFATALHMIGTRHDIDPNHYVHCFKHGLKTVDRRHEPCGGCHQDQDGHESG